MKKIFALLALTSFISLTVLAEEPVKSCDSKKEGKSCCKKEASAEKGKSCCSKDAAAKSGSCSKDAKASCSHEKEAAAKPAGCGHDHGKAEVKSDK
jgi:hypothetical protein